MKRRLYEIDKAGWHGHDIPFMPKVLANKTAKQMNRQFQREYPQVRKALSKCTTSKTSLLIKDGTPHGKRDWFAYYYG